MYHKNFIYDKSLPGLESAYFYNNSFKGINFLTLIDAKPLKRNNYDWRILTPFTHSHCYIINQDLLEKANAKHTDVEGFTDFVRSIKGVEVAFMILEQRYDIRINLRSRGKYIIRDIAEYFGGGGHKLAAGATIKDISIEKVESKIVDLLNRKKNINGN